MIRILVLLSLSFTGVAFGAPNWPASLAGECATGGAGWIFCDDFEVDRSVDYFEGQPNIESGSGVAGSNAAAFTFQAGSQSGGGLKVAFGRTPDSYMAPVDSGSADYREIYWRMFVKVPQNWNGNGADKLSRALIFARSDWTVALLAHVWSGTDPGNQSHLLLLDPASGTDTQGNLQSSGYNDFDNYRWLGQTASDYDIFSNENFGEWQCVEAHLKLNAAGSNDGVFELYINQNLEAQKTNQNFVGAYDDYGINSIFFENYWNTGSPVTQTRHFDNLVISTQPIGCGVNGGRPKPPVILP